MTLQKLYNAIVVATGCQKPQKHGEFGSNIVSSHEFINWYNCPSDFCQIEPMLNDSSNEVILGQGNVAMDVVWILLSKPEMMMASDFSQKGSGMLETVKSLQYILSWLMRAD